MYSNGYLNISECEKAKAKLLKIPDASGMCDYIIIEDSEIVKKKEFEPKNFKEYNSPPVIKISRSITVYESNYKILGEVEDNSDKIFIEVDGSTILAKDGKFEISRFSPVNEKLEITAIDKWGNLSEPVVVEIIIDNKSKKVAKKIEPLNPKKNNSIKNIHRVALISGIE